MIESKITELSVYRSGCIMKRRATVCLEAGPQRILLGGLTGSVDENSLRLFLPEGLQGSNVQLEYLKEEEKEARLKELKEKIAALTRRKDLAGRQAERWEQNADFSGRENLALSEMTAYLEDLPKRLEELADESARLGEEIVILKKQLDKERRAVSLPHVSAEITARKAGSYPLEFSYREMNAGWEPFYEIHAEGSGEELSLRLRSRIRQNSGQDWENVKLSLYTGNPAISGNIPKLPSSHIRIWEPSHTMGFESARAGKAMAKAARAMEDAMVMEEAAVPAPYEAEATLMMNQVTVGGAARNQGDTMTEYEIAGSWTLRDGQEILCDLSEKTIPCRHHVVSVPKMGGEGYLAARVRTADLEELQDSFAAIYLKGDFAGQVCLEPDMTKEHYDLSLGIDEGIRVKRIMKKRHQSQQLLKGQKKTEYEYEITVSSRKEKETELTLWDQLPVSDDKSISVEIQEISEALRDEESGLLSWEFSLAPGETRSFRLAYSVAWPKDKQTREYPVEV